MPESSCGNTEQKKNAASPSLLKTMLQSPPLQTTVKLENIPTPCSSSVLGESTSSVLKNITQNTLATKTSSLRRKPEARPTTQVMEENDNRLKNLPFKSIKNDSSPVYSPAQDENWPPIISSENDEDEESKGSFLNAEDSILTTFR